MPPPCRLAVAALIVPLLAGCGDMRENLEYADARMQHFASRFDRAFQPAPKAPPAAEAPAPPTAAAGRSRPARSALRDMPVPPPKPDPASMADGSDDGVDPQRLIGAGPTALVATLGEPTTRRTEGVAQVWRYGSGACALDLYLYPDVAGGTLHALAWRRPEGCATTR